MFWLPAFAFHEPWILSSKQPSLFYGEVIFFDIWHGDSFEASGGGVAFVKKLFGQWNIRYPAPARAHSSTYLVNYFPIILFSLDILILSLLKSSHARHISALHQEHLEKGPMYVMCVAPSPPAYFFGLGVLFCPTILLVKGDYQRFDS